MKLVISNGIALAKHLDSQDILSHYPGCTIVSVEDGTTVETGRSWTVTLEATQTTACARIDAKAEALRQGVLTPGSGQAAEYYLTHAEALNYLALVSAGKTPTDTDYPFLLAEQAALAATTGAVTLAAVATAIMVIAVHVAIASFR